jgi:hypothetical protein
VKNFADGRNNPLKSRRKSHRLLGSEVGRKPDTSSILVAFMSDDLGHPKLGPHGGRRVKGQRSAEVMPSGGRRDYILARLERDGRHDLAEAIREGRVSALTVAVELGWTKRPETLGLGSGNAAKRRQHQLRALTDDALSPSQAMELWLGPGHAGSLFNSREELEAAWTANRDELMARWGSHGRRPAAFYEFEWDGPRPAYAVERSVLWRAAGVLSEAERTELESGWEAAFVEARGMAAQERREHYAHHDVPHELIKAWTADRRRRGRRPSTADSTATSAATSEGAAVK